LPVAAAFSFFFLLVFFADALDSALDSPGEYKTRGISLWGDCLWWLVLLVDSSMIMKLESSLDNTMVEVQESKPDECVLFNCRLWPKKLGGMSGNLSQMFGRRLEGLLIDTFGIY
jgi:hypothetical protein